MTKKDTNEFVKLLLPDQTPLLNRLALLLLGLLLVWGFLAGMLCLLLFLIGHPVTFLAAIGWAGLWLLVVGTIAVLKE